MIRVPLVKVRCIPLFRFHYQLWCFLLLTAAFTSCHKSRKVNLSFYYWKTTYRQQPTEARYLKALHCRKLYLRIMDIDLNASGAGLAPVSPVTFKSPVAADVALVPVVFIVNKALLSQTHQQLDNLAGKIVPFVQAKAEQAGKTGFEELQIDCDWTRTTRDNYFYLLKSIKGRPELKGRLLSVTLRLHQLKNRQSSGVPPVNRVMLMCYNMGDLRRYGPHNSILEQSDLEKYAGSSLSSYGKHVDVGLPLFSWAVVFRQHEYAGISKRMNQALLLNPDLFASAGNNQYRLQTDMPAYGLQRGDEIRWEAVETSELQNAARYIARYINTDTINVIYFSLDAQTLTHYPYETLEKTAALFR